MSSPANNCFLTNIFFSHDEVTQIKTEFTPGMKSDSVVLIRVRATAS